MGRIVLRKQTLLGDIAGRLGVSVSTVSRVLNNRDSEIGIKPQTRQKVLEMARRLDYQPHWQARGLRLGQSQVLGVCMPKLSYGSGLRFELLRGLFNAAAEHQLMILLIETKKDMREDIRAIQHFVRSGVDGIIFWQRINMSAVSRYLNQAQAQGIPVVTIVERDRDCHCPFVGVDHIAGGIAATEHLIKLGHRKIGYLGLLPGSRRSGHMPPHRYLGYRLAMKKHGLPCFRRYIIGSKASNVEDGCLVMERLLTCSDTPTAVFAYNDKIAVGARRALLAAGKSVPQDIALVGYDGDEFVAYLDFPLTTVSQPLYEVGRRAVEISSSRAAVGDLCLLKPELIVRASCGTGHNGAGIMAGFKGRSKKEQSA